MFAQEQVTISEYFYHTKYTQQNNGEKHTINGETIAGLNFSGIHSIWISAVLLLR